MKMTARVLEIDGQFLYIPSCMIISFDDASTHTTEVKLVRSAQGVDLGKLQDTHEIYKEVVHDIIGVEEATQRLEEIINRKQKHHPWYVCCLPSATSTPSTGPNTNLDIGVLVGVYGLASATVGPFAFGARLIDMPIAFVLGSLLGMLQLIVAPKSDLYSNVFEISAAVLTSFLARVIGSTFGGRMFCFSALAQSSIALILPGYTVCTYFNRPPVHLSFTHVFIFLSSIHALIHPFTQEIIQGRKKETTRKGKKERKKERKESVVALGIQLTCDVGYSMWLTRVTIQESSSRFRSNGVRHHLLAFLGLWHHHRHCHVRPHRCPRHVLDDLSR